MTDRGIVYANHRLWEGVMAMHQRLVALLAVLLLAGGAASVAADPPREPSVAETSSNALLDGARTAFQAQKYELATDLLQQSLDKWQENAVAVYLLAQTREKLEQGQEAAALYKRYLELTQGEGQTPQRVMADLRARKLDARYDRLATLREEILRDAKELLAGYGDELSEGERAALEAVKLALGGGATDEEAVEVRPRPGPAIDLLALVDAKRDRVGGEWSKDNEGLHVRATRYARIALPICPQGSYHLSVEFAREGKDAVWAILPVGRDRQVGLVLCGWGNKAGLDSIDGKGGKDNPSTVFPSIIESGRLYILDIRAIFQKHTVAIEACLDGKRHVFWQGPVESLSISPGWKLRDPRVLGIGAHEQAVFRSVKLRMLSGTARTLP